MNDITITAALVGVVGAVLGALIAGWFSAHVAVKSAIRLRKQDAYKNYLFALSGVRFPSATHENYAFPRMLEKYKGLVLVAGSRSVLKALTDFSYAEEANARNRNDLLARLVVAMRRDLEGLSFLVANSEEVEDAVSKTMRLPEQTDGSEAG